MYLYNTNTVTTLLYLIAIFVKIQVINDEETDELAAYFTCEVIPKVLITSSDRSKVVRLDKIQYTMTCHVCYTPLVLLQISNVRRYSVSCDEMRVLLTGKETR